jgi:hypothetical protein
VKQSLSLVGCRVEDGHCWRSARDLYPRGFLPVGYGGTVQLALSLREWLVGEIQNPEKSSKGRARRKKKDVPRFLCTVQSYILGTHQNQNCDRLPYVVRIHHSTTLSPSLFSLPTSQEANARESRNTRIHQDSKTKKLLVPVSVITAVATEGCKLQKTGMILVQPKHL